MLQICTQMHSMLYVKHTLIIEVLVESVQPVLQLITGFCAEDNSLRSLRRWVDDGQASRFLACRLLFNNTDPGVLKYNTNNLSQAGNQ